MSTDGPLRLNLGCGLHAPAGWVNIDRSPSLRLGRVPGATATLHRLGFLSGQPIRWPANVRCVDVTKRLPFGTRTAAAIYSSHMLEHLYFDEANRVLRECRRVLVPGGIIRLALPDVEQFVRQLLAAPPDAAASAALTFTRNLRMAPMARPSRRDRLVGRFSGARHRWQPTASLVIAMLTEAGFVAPAQRDFRCGDLPDLAVIEHRSQGMFIEASA